MKKIILVLYCFLCQLSHVALSDTVTLQPGPGQGKDIWTTSVFSYAPGGGGPGGGLDNDVLRVGGWGDLYYSLLQFPLDNLPTTATSVTLRLYNGDSGAASIGMFLDRITTFWDWKTQGTGSDRLRLWWADRPSAVQWIANPLPAPAKNSFYDIDITDLYNAWQNGDYPNYGLQLRPEHFPAGPGPEFNQFYSSDYTSDPTLRPQLVITYSPSPGENAAELVNKVVGAPYLGDGDTWGGKGWDGIAYVSPDQIKNGYHFWNNKLGMMDFGAGLDCSGLVLWSYNRASGATQYGPECDKCQIRYEGADGQFRDSLPISGALMPGDLLFFNKSLGGYNPQCLDPDKALRCATHVAMYVGGDNVIEAYAPGIGIKLSSKSVLEKEVVPDGLRRPKPTVTPPIPLIVKTGSPASLIVADPDGFTISAETVIQTDEEYLREIPGNLYYSVATVDANGRPNSVIYAPTLKTGDYLIKVVPLPGAAPTDTYSLEVKATGTSITFAKNFLISEIPSQGYGFKAAQGVVKPLTAVVVDIKPGEAQNIINPKSKGVIPVAIISTDNLDATTIDPLSVKFGPGRAIEVHNRGHVEDANGDGRPDLVLHFNTQSAVIKCGDKFASATGKTFTGQDVGGFDSIHTLGCK